MKPRTQTRLPVAGAAVVLSAFALGAGTLLHAEDPETIPATIAGADAATSETEDDPAESAEEHTSFSDTLMPGQGTADDLLKRERLDVFAPPGRSHRGVRYPSYRRMELDPAAVDPVTGVPVPINAPLESLFEADLVTRLDADHVQFDRAVWTQFTPEGITRLTIERGVYDLRNDILMSNQPIRIETPQYVINAGQILHDRKTGLTRLTQNVSMAVYQEQPQPVAPAADPAEPEAPTPAP